MEQEYLQETPFPSAFPCLCPYQLLLEVVEAVEEAKDRSNWVVRAVCILVEEGWGKVGRGDVAEEEVVG